MNTKWFRLGAFLMALAVALGAFGAHGLKNILDSYSLAIYEKAIFYHFVHALGIVIISSSNILSEKIVNRVAIIFILGISLFSGSLYLLAITGAKWLGMITPLGGVSFIVGWTIISFGFLDDR